MTDEEGTFDPKKAASEVHYGESLLYDFAKFFTTLSLLVIGGILTVTATADPADVKPVIVACVLATIALAAILSVSVAHALVEARSEGRAPREGLHRLMKGATGLLGAGAGGFLMMWWDSMS